MDDLGNPVIRTLGTRERDCCEYNPPTTCISILEALQHVDPSTWDAHVSSRCSLFRRHCSYMDAGEVSERVSQELAAAREVFAILLKAYEKAVEKEWGVSCEYSL